MMITAGSSMIRFLKFLYVFQGPIYIKMGVDTQRQELVQREFQISSLTLLPNLSYDDIFLCW